MFIFKNLLMLCLAFVMCSCAGQKTALTKGQENLNVSEKSIALLFVRISNENKPNYQLKLENANIPPLAKAGDTFGNWMQYLVKIDNPYKSEPDKYNEYLLTFHLEPGSHYFRWLSAEYTAFPVISAHCIIYLNMKLEIKPKSVIYLGHIDAVVRKKNDGEETNISIFPLIDQAAAGLSTGVLEVAVTDKYDDDLKLFYSEFPGLKHQSIEKSILPQWANAKNEMQWRKERE